VKRETLSDPNAVVREIMTQKVKKCAVVLPRTITKRPSFTRRVVDHITDEVVNVLPDGQAREFKAPLRRCAKGTGKLFFVPSHFASRSGSRSVRLARMGKSVTGSCSDSL
jgi:hypothetical protein